jgi:plasmid stabilization system protein ParE
VSTPVVILAGAESDIQRIYNRLTDRRDGSGDEFMDRLANVFVRLETFPESSPVRLLGMRRALVPGHIFGVFYTIEPRGVMIHAIADLRQDTDYLERMLRDRIQ